MDVYDRNHFWGKINSIPRSWSECHVQMNTPKRTIQPNYT